MKSVGDSFYKIVSTCPWRVGLIMPEVSLGSRVKMFAHNEHRQPLEYSPSAKLPICVTKVVKADCKAPSTVAASIIPPKSIWPEKYLPGQFDVYMHHGVWVDFLLWILIRNHLDADPNGEENAYAWQWSWIMISKMLKETKGNEEIQLVHEVKDSNTHGIPTAPSAPAKTMNGATLAMYLG